MCSLAALIKDADPVCDARGFRAVDVGSVDH